MSKAYKAFGEDDWQAGNEKLDSGRMAWRLSMLKCHETNHKFTTIMHNLDSFFDADDWKSAADENYAGNKDYIDQQWDYMNNSWETGVYYNAGMFYARVAAAFTNQTLLPLDLSEDPFYDF